MEKIPKRYRIRSRWIRKGIKEERSIGKTKGRIKKENLA